MKGYIMNEEKKNLRNGSTSLKAGDNQMREAFAEKVKNTVGIIRQNLQGHGGNIELIGIDENNTVKVRLQCESENCPEAQQVLKTGVKELLKQRIPEVKEVLTVD